MAAAWAWVVLHDQAIGLVVAVYLAVSLAKMPPPAAPLAYSAWWLVRALACFAWDEWGGRMKWPFLPPVPWPPAPWAVAIARPLEAPPVPLQPPAAGRKA